MISIAASTLLLAIAHAGAAERTDDNQLGPAVTDVRAANMWDNKTGGLGGKGCSTDRASTHDQRSMRQQVDTLAREDMRAAHLRDGKSVTTAKTERRDHGSVPASAVATETDVAQAEVRAAHMADNKIGQLSGKTGSRIQSGEQSGSAAEASASTPVVVDGSQSVPMENNRDATSASQVEPTVGGIPAAVLATIDRETGGIQPSSIEQRSVNGRTIYDARVPSDGNDLRLKIAEDGSIVWRNDLKQQARREEQQARLQSQTPALQEPTTTPLAAEPSAREQAVSRDPADSKPQDDPLERRLTEPSVASGSNSGSSAAASIPPAGRRLAIEQLPVAPKETIVRESNGMPIVDLRRETDHGRSYYLAKYKAVEGKDVKLKVAEDGSVVSRK
ncbi:MAG: hypothetical protein H0W83_13120 [Planctomycetes bacterium]|nr:hypothetical protein [Planctomycetota bacterium]